MSGYTIKIEDNSNIYTQYAEQAAIKALTMCGMTAEGYAKNLCPVKTGNLRNSITYSVNDGTYVAYIGTNVEYATYVELGTKYAKAQPYLQPAVADHADRYREIIYEYFTSAI